MIRLHYMFVPLFAGSLIAAAQPARAGGKACIPAASEITLHATPTGAAVCAKPEGKPEVCFAVSPTTDAVAGIKPAAAPASAPIAITVTADGKACNGPTCKTLGKRAAAAIAKATAAEKQNFPDHTVPVLATMDLKSVVFGDRMFSIAKDKEIKLKAPKEYRRRSDKPQLGTLDVVGNAVIANWLDCAGPCAMGVVVDAAGANKGTWFNAGTPMVLDGTRVAIIPSDSAATITVLDTATAKQFGRIELSDGVLDVLEAKRASDGGVVALWSDASSQPATWKVSWLSVMATKPTATATKSIAICP